LDPDPGGKKAPDPESGTLVERHPILFDVIYRLHTGMNKDNKCLSTFCNANRTLIEESPVENCILSALNLGWSKGSDSKEIRA
jgi:hypothetical protein